MRKGRVAVLTATALCCAVAAGGVAVAGDGNPENPIPPLTPEAALAPADITSFCAVPQRGLFKVTDVVKGRSPEGGREVTEIGEGGIYRVSRCDAGGRLEESMTVGPIPVPGGRTALVPLTEVDVMKDGMQRHISGVYGSPADPRWAAEWEKHGDRITAGVLPVTPAEREVK
jgi:hypothetical protein